MHPPDTEVKKTLRTLGTHQSLYDPGRETVGAIYQKAQAEGEKDVLVGDMANEFTKSLIEDINEGLCKPRYNDYPFYLIVHEKKDLQMKSSMLRRIIYHPFRPWPEDDTTVFWKNPKTQEVRFCWALPHWSEMDNILANPTHFDPEFVSNIQSWKSFDLTCFGFIKDKDEECEWVPNPNWKDKPIKQS